MNKSFLVIILFVLLTSFFSFNAIAMLRAASIAAEEALVIPKASVRRIFARGFSSIRESIDFTVHLRSDFRDFWWNDDFLLLMQRRLNLVEVKTALDVGCGMGHWTRRIYPLLARDVEITGVDIDERFLEEARVMTDEAPLDLNPGKIKFQKTDAYEIPFGDETFDLVTCQTLLMHLKDPERTIAEMLRVLKPGGRLLLAEPNNYANIVRANTAQEELSIEERIDIVRLYAMVEEGKKRLGMGNMGVCSYLSKMLKSLGCEGVEVYRNDKVFYLSVPYTREQEVLATHLREFTENDYFYIFPPESARMFFEAVSTDESLYTRLIETSRKLNAIYKRQIDTKSLEGTFGGEMLVTVGRKYTTYESERV